MKRGCTSAEVESKGLSLSACPPFGWKEGASVEAGGTETAASKVAAATGGPEVEGGALLGGAARQAAPAGWRADGGQAAACGLPLERPLDTPACPLEEATAFFSAPQAATATAVPSSAQPPAAAFSPGA